jgi:hypothetical protein
LNKLKGYYYTRHNPTFDTEEVMFVEFHENDKKVMWYNRKWYQYRNEGEDEPLICIFTQEEYDDMIRRGFLKEN